MKLNEQIGDDTTGGEGSIPIPAGSLLLGAPEPPLRNPKNHF